MCGRRHSIFPLELAYDEKLTGFCRITPKLNHTRLSVQWRSSDLRFNIDVLKVEVPVTSAIRWRLYDGEIVHTREEAAFSLQSKMKQLTCHISPLEWHRLNSSKKPCLLLTNQVQTSMEFLYVQLGQDQQKPTSKMVRQPNGLQYWRTSKHWRIKSSFKEQ